MVDEAKNSKPKIQGAADTAASRFAVAILTIAIFDFIMWLLVEYDRRHHSLRQSAIEAMAFSISVLVISCPCAIGLAVPMVTIIAAGVGSKKGLILKNTEVIETARKITHVVFNKTGTLTQGKLSIVKEDILIDLIGFSDKIASLVLGITKDSTHLVSKAVATCLSASGVQPLVLQDVVSILGESLHGSFVGNSQDFLIQAGNPDWLKAKDSETVREDMQAGLTVFCVTVNETLVATFGLQDQIRPDVLDTIMQLKMRGGEGLEVPSINSTFAYPEPLPNTVVLLPLSFPYANAATQYTKSSLASHSSAGVGFEMTIEGDWRWKFKSSVKFKAPCLTIILWLLLLFCFSS
ncbi:hypothetical protein B0J14DRAFT_681405 [Halenospora varia]|nr:hypothetical protein B0J14DRAFT_681405 [Halenospora varia]